MIGAFFSSLTNKLFAGAVIVLLLAVGVQSWRLSNVKADYAEHRAEVAEIARKAALQARKADAVARDTVAARKTAVEAGNEAARAAAKDSADPLKAGLEALR